MSCLVCLAALSATGGITLVIRSVLTSGPVCTFALSYWGFQKKKIECISIYFSSAYESCGYL